MKKIHIFVLTLCCWFDHLRFCIRSRALFSAEIPSSSDQQKATETESASGRPWDSMGLPCQLMIEWVWITKSMQLTLKILESVSMNEEMDDTRFHHLDCYGGFCRWCCSRMKSSLLCHWLPHIYLGWTNSELMWAGCMTWTVPCSKNTVALLWCLLEKALKQREMLFTSSTMSVFISIWWDNYIKKEQLE